MARRHKPEDIIGKLREAEIMLAQGSTVADVCRRIGVTEQSYYRWRKEYGGLKLDQARRMKELEKENARLRRAPVAVSTASNGSAAARPPSFKINSESLVSATTSPETGSTQSTCTTVEITSGTTTLGRVDKRLQP